MLDALTAGEWVGWQQYLALEPLPFERAEIVTAIQTSVIANSTRDPKKRREPYRARDFMLDLRTPSERARQSRDAALATQRWEQLQERARQINRDRADG